jgi:hypothetical protein
LETNSVSGFSPSSLVIFDSGCVRKTCGSFWKIAATATTGTLLVTASNDINVFAVMKKSILPEISSIRSLPFGPPGTMVTSSPYFL